jgi:hypothetical protein
MDSEKEQIKTSYDVNKEYISKYMKKRPSAMLKTQHKYQSRPEIKEKASIYHKEYMAWLKYLNNDVTLYERKLFYKILID